VVINYQSIGSGAGIKQIIEGTVDFGASDAPMSEEQLRMAPREILHIPTALGAVVVAYNLPGAPRLRLTPDVLADIFLGRVSRWDDPRIKELNPGVALPGMEIRVVHRSDGSGTTFVFTDYLSAVSREWRERVGKGTAVRWPVGIGQKGNEGVAGQVKQLEGAVGYMELAYAVQNDLPFAEIRNRAGNFVTADPESIAAAAATASLPPDLRTSIVNPPGERAYPIAAFTYILIYREQQDRAKGKALVDFLWWAIHEGDSYARELFYVPLPPQVKKLVEAKLRSVTHGGKPLL